MFHNIYVLAYALVVWCGHGLSRYYRIVLHFVKNFDINQTLTKACEDNSHSRIVSSRQFDDIPRQGYPIIGDFFGILWNNRRHHVYFTELHERHGPLFRARVGKYDFLFLADLDGIKKVSRACGKSPLRTGVSLLLDARKDIGREPGVFSVDGDLWLDYRRKMTSSLIRSDFTEATKMVSAATNDFLVRTKHICDKEGKVSLEYELDKYTTQVLGLLLYSQDFGCFDETGQSDGVKCVDNVRLMFQALHKMLYYPAWYAKTFCRKTWSVHQTALTSIFNITQKWVDQAVMEATEHPEVTTCMLHHMIHNNVMTDEPETLYANIADLMIAGVHTLSTSLQIGLHVLSQHPDVQRKLHDEICNTVKDDENLNEEHIQRMPYLQAVMEEIHRMYPVVLAVSRKLDEDTEICNYRVPKGADIVVPTFAVGRSKQIFSDADVFRPERWLKDGKSMKTFSTRNIMYPTFGIGARMCMGKRLADLETSILYASLYRKYRTMLSDDTPFNLEFETTMLTLPKVAVSLRLVEW